MKVVWLLVAGVLSAVVAGVIIVPLSRWLQEDVGLTYYESNDMRASVGLSRLQEDLTAYVDHLEYKDSPYSSIRVVRYVLENQDSRSLNEAQTFYFVLQSGGQTSRISNAAIVDISWNPTLQQSTVPLLKRTDDPELGPGFTVVSAFPGNSRIEVLLVLDTGDYPELGDARIAMGKQAGKANLVEKTSFPRTFNLAFSNLLIIAVVPGVAATLLWGAAWLFINNYYGNYTVGGRMWDSLLQRLLHRRPFEALVRKRRRSV